MDRLLTRLRIRRKDKPEAKCLPKNLREDNNDNDDDYVFNPIDRSLGYECKRLSQSYTLLSDPPELNNRRLNGSASVGALNTICLENNVINNKKTNKRKTFWTSKQKSTVVPPNGQKKGLFSWFRLRSNRRSQQNQAENDKDTNLHVLWYKAYNEPEEASESRVHFRHSWQGDPKKEIATSIAAEFESRTKTQSLFLKNRDRLSVLSESEEKAKF